MSKQKRTWDVILVVVMVLLCLLWIYPIVLILLNSLKTEGSFYPPLRCSVCPPPKPLPDCATTFTA